MTDSTERRAALGELCTCGRQAIAVYSNVEFGDVGYCGIEDGQARPVLPCPWCGSTEPHRASWGDPGKCPDYQLRAPSEPGERNETHTGSETREARPDSYRLR